MSYDLLNKLGGKVPEIADQERGDGRNPRSTRDWFACPMYLPKGTIGASGGKSRSMARDPKRGFIWSIPFGSTAQFVRINPYTKTAALVGAAPGVTGVMDGACYAPDSDTIVMAPSGASAIAPREFNLATEAISANYTGTSLGATVNKYAGMVWTPQGCYGIPSTAATVLVANPVAKTFSTFGAVGAGTLKWLGGVYTKAKTIWCAPYQANTVLVIDTLTNTVRLLSFDLTALSLNGSTSQRFCGAGLTEEGNVIFFAYAGGAHVIFDPIRECVVGVIRAHYFLHKNGGSFSILPYPSSTQYADLGGACPTPNGKFIGIPRFTDNSVLNDATWNCPTEIDIDAKTSYKFSGPSSLPTGYTKQDDFPYLSNGCAAEDGIYYMPYSGDAILFIATPDRYTRRMLTPPDDLNMMHVSMYNRFMNRSY